MSGSLSPKTDDNDRPDQLPDQLLIWLDVEKVIDQADEKKKRAAADDDKRFVVLGTNGSISDQASRAKIADAAKHRRRPLMPAVGFWLGDKPVLDGKPPRARRTVEHRGDQNADRRTLRKDRVCNQNPPARLSPIIAERMYQRRIACFRSKARYPIQR